MPVKVVLTNAALLGAALYGLDLLRLAQEEGGATEKLPRIPPTL
jgi:hypothetical protein